MKKVTTTATNRLEKLQRLTIGLDLGDRSSHYCVLDESGHILTESKTATSPNAIEEVFGKMSRARIALFAFSGYFECYGIFRQLISCECL